MTDLLQQLRQPGDEVFSTRKKCLIADEIERLRKEITGLQELKVVVENPEFQEVLFSSLNGKLKRLQAENAELRVNSERYLWLRDTGDATWRPIAMREGGDASDVDKAIDAAIKARTMSDGE